MAQKQFYANLQPSEMAIFRAAADIFSGYVAAGQVSDGNEDEMIPKAVRIAVKMADVVDRAVQSDDEISG